MNSPGGNRLAIYHLIIRRVWQLICKLSYLMIAD